MTGDSGNGWITEIMGIVVMMMMMSGTNLATTGWMVCIIQLRCTLVLLHWRTGRPIDRQSEPRKALLSVFLYLCTFSSAFDKCSVVFN